MNLIKLSAIESTNDYLKQLSSSTEATDGTVVWTEDQTRGKGQMGATWYSEKGKSLTFSVLKKLGKLNDHGAFGISMAVSVAVAESLEDFEVPHVSIKWPNDIMSANKKLGGILIENQLRKGKIASSIIGLGINVGEFDHPTQFNSISIQSITGKHYVMEDLIKKFSNDIVTGLAKLSADEYPGLKEKYYRRLFGKDKVLTFEGPGNEIFSGIIRGVDDLGLLQVETASAGIRSFDIKEVKFKF